MSAGLRVLLAGGLVLAAGAAPAQQGGNPSLTGSVSQRFEADTNFDLDDPSPGTSYRSVSTLGVTYLTETRTESFRLSSDTSLRVIDDETGTDTIFSLPSLDTRYSRQGARSSFSAGARFRETPVEFLRPFELEFDDEGGLILPGDPEDFTGTGARRTWGADAALTFGTGGPAEIRVAARAAIVDYDADADVSQNPTETYTLSSSLNLRLSPVTTASLSLSGERFTAEDAEETERETYRLRAGLSYAVNPRLSYSAGIGAVRREEMTTGGTETETNAALDVGVNFVPDDTRRLSANIGLEETGDDTVATADVTLSLALPQGELSAGLNRSLTFGDEGEDLAVTSARVSFAYPINTISSANLGLSYSLREDLDDPGVEDITRLTLSAGYRRALNERLSLDVGYAYRLREEGPSEADSHSLSVGVSMPFDF